LGIRLNKLKPGENSPFLLIDLRENHERELMDLPKYTKTKALIPRVNIPLDDLLMGYYPDKLPKNKYLILVCDKGLKSGRAADFLKRNGYSIKILIGGLETLDNFFELEYNDPYMR
jgi:rhodanese-related sulfurtransferase